MIRPHMSSSLRASARDACASVLLVLSIGAGASGQCEFQQLEHRGPASDFGRAVAVSGDRAVVGDPGTGAVVIYARDGHRWIESSVLRVPGTARTDTFGFAVAIDGNTIAVGDHHAHLLGFESGAVHVFRGDGDGWALEATLTPADGDGNDHFGRSVAIDGDLLLAGAPSTHQNRLFQAGAAYVFRFDGRAWEELAALDHPDPAAADGFGWAASIDDGVALVAAPWRDREGFTSAGSVLAFRAEGDGWTLEQELTAPGPASNAWFGTSVAMRAGVAVVGAIQADDQAGAAWAFRRAAPRWRHEATLRASDASSGAFFGIALAMSDDVGTIVVGASNDDAPGNESGSAYAFLDGDGGWHETAKMTASDGRAGDHFGASVAVAGDVGIVGATGGGAGPGAAYVYLGLAGLDCNGNGEPDACDIAGGWSEDENGNGVPDPCETMGDMNGDGSIDVADLIAVVLSWGTCPTPCPPACTADANADCQVDLADLLVVVLNWS